MSQEDPNPDALQVVVLPPQAGDSNCDEGKRDDQLAEITMIALKKFGELADLGTRERVEILTIRHGWGLPDVKRALGISQQAVNKHWHNICAELDIEDMPKRQRAMLARQCDTMFQRAARMEDEGKGIVLALKAIELKAKLLGLNMEALPVSPDTLPYATPAEIADDVRLRVLEIHKRPELLKQGGK